MFESAQAVITRTTTKQLYLHRDAFPHLTTRIRIFVERILKKHPFYQRDCIIFQVYLILHILRISYRIDIWIYKKMVC